MKLQRERLFSAVALAGLTLLAGCKGQAAKRVQGAHWYVFVDVSGSIRPAQRTSWLSEAAKLIRVLGPGCQLTVHAVHDQTMSARPLLDVEIPEISQEAGLDELTRGKRALRHARESARSTLTGVFQTGGDALRTDLMSAVDRVKPDAHSRPTKAVFFSDMLNSTEELNLERKDALDRPRIPVLIQSIASRHRWHNRTLDGVDVYCVLTSLASGDPPPPTDRRILKDFYESLFQALGARLVLFDTHLQSGRAEFAKGGNHNDE